MPFIHGVFLVNFGQPPLIVQPETLPTAGQFLPAFEFLFVLRSRAHEI